MSREIKHIGMDVHKEAIVIAVLDGGGKQVMESIVETQASSISTRRRRSAKRGSERRWSRRTSVGRYSARYVGPLCVGPIKPSECLIFLFRACTNDCDVVGRNPGLPPITLFR
jgi:hypothetical protein